MVIQANTIFFLDKYLGKEYNKATIIIGVPSQWLSLQSPKLAVITVSVSCQLPSQLEIKKEDRDGERRTRKEKQR